MPNLMRRLFVAEVASHEAEGHGDAAPQEYKGAQGAKGHRTAALLTPHQKVEGEEDG
jgi:hypothetical protein